MKITNFQIEIKDIFIILDMSGTNVNLDIKGTKVNRACTNYKLVFFSLVFDFFLNL